MATLRTAPTLADIQEARQRLLGIAEETPIYLSESLSRRCGREVRLKAENLQRTGSFKVRGAVNKLSTLSDGGAGGRRRRRQRGQPRPGGRVGRTRARHAGDDLRAAGRADGEGRGVPELRRDDGDDRGCSSRTRSTAARAARRGDGRDVHPPLRGPARDRGAGHDRARARRAGARRGHGARPDRRRRALGRASRSRCARCGPDVRLVGVQARHRRATRSPTASPSRSRATSPCRCSRICSTTSSRSADEEISEAIVLLLERAKLVVEGAGAVGVAALLSGKAGRRRARPSRFSPAGTSTRRC